ncbi:MAG: 50S ribosomal protein L18 [Candidatus Izemoplasmatales bacterium]|nr:50S ribosomal protein L18 [Candidatus Izemoplasmatales bacterium]MDD4069044.1 50S ribosomal protein L18 [Candidatus Izemoplasmatales bacterium]MDY0138593.1 50S ribosomal protein L18 [Candidatus Izemoplasmatales bacterium]
MFKSVNKNAQRQKRHRRMRFQIIGTPERPRLNVFRSNKQIYAQIIDDINQVTLAQANSREIEGINGSNTEGASKVGQLVAQRAIEKNVKTVVFDRGGYLYHGRVKALAEAAREAGLEF